MKMKIENLIHKFGLAAAALTLLAVSGTANAQNQLPTEEIEVNETVEVTEPESPVTYTLTGSEKKLIAERIAQWNNPWKKVELSGKVNLSGLPINPSVKIFMESDKTILISIRAVFLGEVARIEMTPDEFVAVNKLKKTYYKADPRAVFEKDPHIISELQALLLGRVAIVGSGEFKADQASKVDIVQQEEDSFLVIPTDLQSDGVVNFGFSVGADGRLEEVIGVYARLDGYASLSYARAGEKLRIKGELVGSKRTTGATLEFEAPDWNPKGFERIKKLSDYREVSFREVLKFN